MHKMLLRGRTLLRIATSRRATVSRRSKMGSSRRLVGLWVAAAHVILGSAIGCGCSSPSPAPNDDLGDVGLELQLANGSTLEQDRPSRDRLRRFVADAREVPR